LDASDASKFPDGESVNRSLPYSPLPPPLPPSSCPSPYPDSGVTPPALGWGPGLSLEMFEFLHCCRGVLAHFCMRKRL